MSHDPYWSMPTINWGPTSSYVYPYPPPPDPPDAGDLIQVPCINRFWLQLLAGAAMQLRNPATWDTGGDDSVLSAVLTQADQLIFMLGSQLACMPIALRLQSCVLQYSQDGGTTWTDTENWAADSCNCTTACIIPSPPKNPIGTPSDQFACNQAGFLATAVIQDAMQYLHDELALGKTLSQFVPDAVATFALKLPLTAFLTLAFTDWYNAVVGVVLSEIEAVATDADLWSVVTCVIYNAIKVVGYLNDTNFAAVATGLGAISYPKAWVPPDLQTYWNNVGLANWQAASNAGALEDVDCSECGAWCHEFDFTVSDQGWISGGYGTYSPGVGWIGSATATDERISIEYNGAAFTCVGMEYTCYTDNNWTGPAVYRSMRYATSTAFVRETDITTAPINPAQNFVDSGFSLAGITELALSLAADFIPSTVRITKARVHGTGPIPNGWNLNCT